jgi:Uma2 family endonuclease
MADTSRNIEIVSVDDYLARERASSHRHEFVNGAVYAMAGGSQRHNIIAGNLVAALNAHLPDRCTAFMSDMKLRLRLDRAEFFYYPDAMVCCGPSDQSLDWRDNPLVVGEVLSPSTVRVDRGENFDAYRQIETLQEYVPIEQDAVHVELFRRGSAWEREVLKAGGVLRLDSIGFAMPVAALYRRVEF